MKGYAAATGILILLCSFYSSGQNLVSVDSSYYRDAFLLMKETKEFRDYSRWAKTKQFYVSSELLPFTDHFDPACQPCLGSVNTKEKAAVQQLRFDLKDKAVGASNSIIYFTNMVNGCFGAVLASTYNKEVVYQKAMLMGKQTVFQFQVENGQVRICSERTMWID